MASNSIRLAVEGCGHGTLHAIYASVKKSCEVKGWDGIDLLIIGGDFQAVRNATDLNAMAVPMKFRELGDFHEYYSGAREAPYLTVFVGGNHEASNHLWELYYGGWVAPNIYYAGAANVLRLGSIRIAGLSGIWKGYNYKKPHFERLPYNSDDVRSIYHVRELDVRKLLQLRSQVDIGISHDWPRGIEWLGNYRWLFKKKDLFEADAKAGNLGSVAAKLVLDRLKPPYWFSAHLHIKYPALVDHNRNGSDGSDAASKSKPSQDETMKERVHNQDEIDLSTDDEETDLNGPITLVKPIKNSDEIDLDDDIDTAPNADSTDIDRAVEENNAAKKPYSEVSEDLRARLPAAFTKKAPTPPPQRGPEPPHTINNTHTNFLALDKCLPNRDFLQLIEITPFDPGRELPLQRPLHLSYDPEWLAITRVFALHEPLTLGDPTANHHQDKGRAHYAPLIDEELKWVQTNVVEKDLLTIPANFELTAQVHNPSDTIHNQNSAEEYNNPQTARFCEIVGIENAFYASEEDKEMRMSRGPRAVEQRRGGGFRGGRGGGDRGRGGSGRGGRGGGRGFGGGRGRGRGRAFG